MQLLLSLLLTSAALALPPALTPDVLSPDSSSDVETYIIKGTPAYVPSQAQLFVRIGDSEEGQGFCGGTLITPRHLLTAAHCLEKARKIEILLGSAYFNKGSARFEIGTDSSYIYPNTPQLRNSSFDEWNDIAILTLPQDAPKEVKYDGVTMKVSPAKLPSAGVNYLKLFENKQGAIAGFGETETSLYSRRLLKGSVTILSDHLCRSHSRDKHPVCTSLTPSGTCFGDSGGPLFVTEADRTDTLLGVIIAGISKEGSDRCEDDVVNVYADVSEYLPWINQVIGG